MRFLFFLAALICFIVAVVVIVWPGFIHTGWQPWGLGALFAWFLCDHVGGPGIVTVPRTTTVTQP